MNNYDELSAILEASKADFEKFETKSNHAAGKRVRKAMQMMIAKAKTIRVDISRGKELID